MQTLQPSKQLKRYLSYIDTYPYAANIINTAQHSIRSVKQKHYIRRIFIQSGTVLVLCTKQLCIK